MIPNQVGNDVMLFNSLIIAFDFSRGLQKNKPKLYLQLGFIKLF
jgi:hypothetical protein